MFEWISLINKANALSWLWRALLLLAVIPGAIKGIITLGKWSAKAVFFCFGWVLPVYISKGKIRSYGFGVEYWLVVPMIYVFGNRYAGFIFAFLASASAATYRWIAGFFVSSEITTTQVGEATNVVNEQVSFFSRISDSLSPASIEALQVITSYLGDMNYLIPVIIVLSLVKLVQLPEIRDEGWLLVFGIAGVAAVALAFNAGSLDGLVSFLSAKYTADKNLFFAWFLFCWFVMIYGLKRGSSFTTYNPINGYLYYNGKLIGKEDEKEDNFTPAKFKIKKRSWFSYLLLCGGLDYASKSAEDHEQNFGLAIAVFLWTCIYDDVEVVDGTSDIVIRRKFSLFNRAEYYGKDLNIEKKKRPTSIPQPKESSPVSSAAPVASVQTPVSTETEVQPEASEVNPQNKIPQTTPQPTEKKPGFFSRLIQRLKKK